MNSHASFFGKFKDKKTCNVDVDFGKKKKVVELKRVTDGDSSSVVEVSIHKSDSINCTLKYFNDTIGFSIQCMDKSKGKQFVGHYYQSDRSGIKEFPKSARLSFKAPGGSEYIKVDCD